MEYKRNIRFSPGQEVWAMAYNRPQKSVVKAVVIDQVTFKLNGDVTQSAGGKLEYNVEGIGLLPEDLVYGSKEELIEKVFE